MSSPTPAPPPAPPGEDRARRSERRAWYMYDWAQSVFTTSVITVFLGPYLTALAEGGAGADGRISVFGWLVTPASLYPYATSLSVLLQLVLLPVLGAFVDTSGRKRELLGVTAYLGAFATMGLYFVHGDRYVLGAGLFVVANVAFGASVVVANAFLPDLASEDERDAVSSRGWATGYLGGALLLALNLALFLSHESLGLEEGHAVRICLVSAGVWWAVFTLIPLARLRNRRRGEPDGAPRRLSVGRSFTQLWQTVKSLRAYPRTLLFLVAYILFNDGIQTVIGFSATFADQALGLDQTVQIGTILMVQFVAFGGALLLGAIARRVGAKKAVLGSLVVWTAVVAVAPLLQEGAAVQFFALAFFIAIVLGGTQALSRSLFSQLIPRGKEAEYFGLYEISDKGSAFLGALALGVVLDATGGDYRLAILSMIVFFALGFVLLLAVDVPAAIRAAGNRVPERV
ncbi:MFS transporter [Thermobifida cellulosilytica]|uniref:MFS transporter n=1 Tax=Thermobifida cellulosilytica TB100 TaxID=665004 RepID=A0A147KJJ9_THECS|nr:MFS transporter [Thermobifida cellulosilytica]KUP97466.1 MFS transporter [Thermobifida cellulosilytica TB100]